MNRTLLNSPLLLGFEHIERLLDRNTNAIPIRRTISSHQRSASISRRGAGFSAEDLSVTVEDNQLVVRAE